MLVNGKHNNGSIIVKSALLKVSKLKFISDEHKHINKHDMFINFCVIIPCINEYLLIETSGLKNDYKMGFNIIGVSSKTNFQYNFDSIDNSRYVSLGELTRCDNLIVKFNELLRLAIPESNLFNPISNIENTNLNHLDAICKIALNRYLCDRVFIDDPEFYKLGELNLY